MIGRTHGVHAEPMTFGLKLALWYAELVRRPRAARRARATIAVGKLSGAVGTFSHLPPRGGGGGVRAARPAARAHRLAGPAARPPRRGHDGPGHRAPPAWRSSPPRSAPSRRPRCARWRSRSGRGRRARSAMPHKRNPVGCEQVTGLARVVRANALAALENVALWHERDISHSSVERVIVPDSFLALDHMLRRVHRHRGGMAVNNDRMQRNLERPGARVLGSAPAGADREGEWARGRLPRRAGPGHGGLAAARAISGRASRTIPRCARTYAPTRWPRSSVSTATSPTWTRSSRGSSAERGMMWEPQNGLVRLPRERREGRRTIDPASVSATQIRHARR